MRFYYFLIFFFCTVVFTDMLHAKSTGVKSKAKDRGQLQLKQPVPKGKTASLSLSTWEKSGNPFPGLEGAYIYASEDQPQVMGVLQTKPVKQLKWKDIASGAVFNEIKANQKKILALMNITDWQVTGHQWKNRGSHYDLSMEGSYLDSQKKKVFFKERHLYFPNEMHHILISGPNKSSLNQNTSKEFIANAKKALLKHAGRKTKT